MYQRKHRRAKGKAKRKHGQVMSVMESTKAGQKDYRSGGYMNLHDGVTVEQEVRSVVNIIIDRIEVAAAPPAAEPEQAAPRKRRRTNAAASTAPATQCKACGLITDPPHSRTSSKLCGLYKPRARKAKS